MRHFPDPENICNQILNAAGHLAPPTNLKVVCNLWPDIRVSEEELDKEGYLIPLGVHGAIILVRKKDSLNRKKFTLAHELGHWALGNLKDGRLSFGTLENGFVNFRTEHKRQTPEEIWCNRFASCLLMPAEDIRDYLQCPEKTGLADRLATGHEVFAVSEQAFLKRISAIVPINIFEVVGIGREAKIRRSFFSPFCREEQVLQAVGELLDFFPELRDLPEGPITFGRYQFQTKLVRNSQYSRSWLASATPSRAHQMCDSVESINYGSEAIGQD